MNHDQNDPPTGPEDSQVLPRNATPAPTPRPRRKWPLALGSLLVTLLIAEIALRILGYGANRGPSFQGYNGTGIRLMCYDLNLNNYLDVDLTDPDVRQTFYRRYGVADMEQTYHYTPFGVVTPCDDHDMRPGQIRPKPPTPPGMPAKIRLIAIGDSFTYGHGLKPGDPWPRQLETLLNAENKDRFEVLNCGVGDTDVAATTHLFMNHLLPLAPDAVIYGWYLNDPVQSAAYAQAQREWMDRSRDEAKHIPDRYISVGWETVTGPRRWSAVYDLVWEKMNERYIGRKSLEWINGMYGPDNAQGWTQSRQMLAVIADACRQNNAQLHLAIWPMLIDLGPAYPFTPAHAALTDACNEQQIPCLDLRDRLRTHPVIDQLILHPADRHPSKLACQIAAEAIRDHLEAQHPDWFR
ncbi:MAG: hypothetical protein JXQ73_20805 [Phycisphaerae bacterium]|nr:hypothetical protein [Phycisphaerae bacterium]